MAEIIQSYGINLLIFLASIFLLKTIISRAFNKLPPSPMALPVIGHMHLLGPKLAESLHKLSQRYGPLVYISIGSTPSIIASTPEIVKEILKDNESCFLNRPNTTNFDYLTYGSADLGSIPYGDHWKFLKKLTMSELLGSCTLNQLLPMRREELKHFLKIAYEKYQAKETISVGKELTRLTNNVITRMMLSTRCSGEENDADDVTKFVNEFTDICAQFNLADSIWFCKGLDLQGFKPRREDARRRYDKMIDRIIQKHVDARKKRKEMGAEADDTVKDILDLLLDIHEDENAERKLTRENIKSYIIMIFVAGTDTTSITLEWALAELINHPEMMEKVKQEIESAVGNTRLVEESDIANLPYLQAIVKETLRLHPAAPLFFRESSQECSISGYKIPAKTRLFVNVWAIGRDPNYWENPLEFRPERFLREESGGKINMLDMRGNHFHLLPFGSGRRSCPGATLALQFMPTTLAAMIQCFEWKVGNGEKNAKVSMEEGTGLTLPLANPLVCSTVPRITPFL